MLIFLRTVCASVLIILIIVVRIVALYRLPKITFILLWSLVVVRLFSPYYLEFSIDNGVLSRMNNLVDTAAAKLYTADALGIRSLAFAAWMIMAAALLFWFFGSHFLARRKYGCSLPVENAHVAKWCAGHSAPFRFRVRMSDYIDSPITCGLFHPVILLPTSMNWENEEHLNFVLTHEFIHIKHCDTLIKWLLVITASLYWFNPLVWVMYVLFNRDIELYCDECVTRQFGSQAKASYAHTLVHFEKHRLGFIPVIGHFGGNSLKERVTAIMKNKTKPAWALLVAAIIVVLLVIIGFTRGTAVIHNWDVPEYSQDSARQDEQASDYEFGFIPAEKD